MIARSARFRVQQLLARHPAVGLLGPRQAGKTTLALELGRELPSLYLDLEAPSDRAKLQEAELYLAGHEDKLVILDEIQRMPGLYQTLRAVIDAGRRKGRRTGRFLVLGPASRDLLQQTAEVLWSGSFGGESELGARHLTKSRLRHQHCKRVRRIRDQRADRPVFVRSGMLRSQHVPTVEHSYPVGFCWRGRP